MSFLKKVGRVISWPARKAAEKGREVMFEFVKQFILKALYGFLGALIIWLTSAATVQVPAGSPHESQMIWALFVGLATGAVALLKKLIAHAAGVDASQVKR